MQLQQDKFKYDPTIKESTVENDEDLKLTKHEIVRLTSKNVLAGSNLVIKQDNQDMKLAKFQMRDSDDEMIGLKSNGNSAKKNSHTVNRFETYAPSEFQSNIRGSLNYISDRTTVGTNKEGASSLFQSDANSIHAQVVNQNPGNNPNSFQNNREILKAKLAAKREQMNQKITAEIANETKMKEGKDEKSVVFPTSFQFKMPPKLPKEPEADPDYSTIKEEKVKGELPTERKSGSTMQAKLENGLSNETQNKQESQTIEESSRSRKKKLIRLSTDEYDKMVSPICSLDLSDPMRFATMPPTPGKIIQLTIIRDKTGIKNKFFPVFHVVFSVG